jgi:uncharacterized membrane protein YfcA
MGVLLMGSLPGIMVGSYSAVRVPERVLRLALAAILIVVSAKIASEELHLALSTATAFALSVVR